MTPYHIIIPRHLSLEEQIALAKQDWVSDSFKTKFPKTEGATEMDIFLHESKEGETTKEWHERIAEEGYKLEGISELCALGSQHPNLQVDFMIIAFGSSWLHSDGDLYSPRLWSVSGRRGADAILCNADRQWDRRNRALVSRKQDTRSLSPSDEPLETWTEEEKRAWDMYAVAFLNLCKGSRSQEASDELCPNYQLVAECADAMLAERRKRFSPKLLCDHVAARNGVCMSCKKPTGLS